MDNTREELINLLCKFSLKQNWLLAVANLADYLIVNGVTVHKWSPVSEPPKERGCYLVTVNHWLDGKPVAREAFWNEEDWLSCEKRQEITPRVTHWMPLPQPPKEG